jgi:drug/metabolite transporter (DMT)-like permease
MALLLLVEPVINPLWAWWLHGEMPQPLAIAGGGLVLAATAWRGVAIGHARPARVSET